MKKGLMQLQTIIYVIFAVIILMVGMFSVQNYMTKMTVSIDFELDNLDSTVLGKRIIGSDKCFLDIKKIEGTSKLTEEDYTVLTVDQGKIDKSKIASNGENCFSGFEKSKVKVKFYELGSTDPFYSWGDADCSPRIELLLRFKDGFGVAEVCTNA